MLQTELIMKKYAITDNQLEEMYRDSKKLIFGNKKVSKLKPVAILTGGQPGAGKSGLVLSSKKIFDSLNRNPIVLDGDTYRGLYPKAIEIAKDYPEFYSEITDKAVGKIMGRLIDDTISSGYDFIREGTLNSAEIVDQLLSSSKGYNIKIKLLAVCREESLLSIFERYLAMKKIMGIGRLTTIESHDKRYIQFPKTARIQANKGIEIEVYERTNKIENPLMIYKTSSNSNKYSCFEEALKKGRINSFNECMKDAERRLKDINQDMKVLKEQNIELSYQLERLNIIINDAIKREENER
mgnify:CR=1 FL=1